MADVPGKFYKATKVRTGVSPSSPGVIEGETLPPLNPPGGGLNSVGLTMPSAFNVANSPLTANGSLDVTGAGTTSQYIRGDGSLASFPSLTGYVPYTGATQNVDLGEFGVDAGFVNLDTTPTNTPTTQGTIYWDDSKSTAALIMNGTIQHIGQDTFFYVKNSTGSSIPKGTAVRFAGTDGASGHLLITPFLANGSVPSTYFMGVTAEVIANGAFGQVMHFGELEGINTSGYTAGSLLYASTTVAGGFQTTVPVAPNNIVLIAATINSKNNGAILVRPTYGSNINTDEGVKITSPATGQLLQLQAGGLWENKTLGQVIGGTSSQFVKGDGSLDSNVYALNSSLANYQLLSAKGQPNGYAGLDSNGKVPLAQINDALIGNVNFQGLWNASTNTPTLANPPAAGTKGYYYIVSTAGTFAGISFEVGDWIISDGSAWGKVDNTDAVSSVFGRTGNVTAANGDYNTSQVTESGNLYFTQARVSANTDVAANTAARHNAVTLGTANGLSLNVQQLSLQLATSGQNGALSSTDWTTFNNKENAITAGTTAQYFRGDKTFQTLNTSVVPELTNLYYTEARVNANANVAANTAARHAAVTLGTANGLSLNVQQLSLGLASAGVTGALSGTDWNTFNSKQNALTNPVTGTGTSGQVAFFNGTTTITGESNLFWDSTNDRLGIGTNTPQYKLDIVNGDIRLNMTSGDWGIIFEDDGTLSVAGTKIWYGNGDGIQYYDSYWTGASAGHLFRTNLNGTTQNVLKLLNTGNALFYNNVTAASFIRSGGTSAQFLKADGSIDSNLYYLASNPAGYTNNVGTVTSVAALTLGTSGTDLSSSVANGTTTPVITLNVPTASAANRGALSAADWTTFNNKQNALTNPVTGTGTTNYLPKFTGTSTIGNSQIFDNGTSVIINGSTSSDARFIANGNSSGYAAYFSQPSIYAGYYRLIRYYTNGNVILDIGSNNGTSIGLVNNQNDTMYFGTNGQQHLTIFGSGNLFVGTSPSDNGARLQVSGGNVTVSDSASPRVSVTGNTSTGFPGFNLSNTTQAYEIIVRGNISNTFQIRNTTASTDLVTITSAGNLGLGVTPSAWDGSLIRAIQITDNGGSISSFSTGNTSSKFTFVSNNAFYDNAGWKYATNGSVAQYRLANDNHQWHIAPSGTAGNAISFTQAMTLDASGRLGIGTPTPGQRLHVNGGSLLVNSGTSATAFRDIMMGGIGGWSTGESHGIDTVYNTADSPTTFSRIESHFDGVSGRIRFRNLFFSSAPRTDILMTIEGNGNVLIGTTTDTGSRLGIKSSGTNSFPLIVQRSANTNTLAAISETSGGDGSFLLANSLGSTNIQLLSNGTSILNGGNVLIGTSTPNGNTLRVGGNAWFDGEVAVNAITCTSGNTNTFINPIGTTGIIYSGQGTTAVHQFLVNSGERFAVLNTGIRTIAPTGGTAVPWRLGTARGGTVTTNATVRVEIDGALVDLVARYV